MKTTLTLALILCCVFLGSFFIAGAQSENSNENKESSENNESVESAARAERAFDAVVQEDRKSKLALTFTPRGTGRTTGHIITLSVQNEGSNPVQLVATGMSGLDAVAFVDDDISEVANLFGLNGKYENGLIDIEGSMAFIPSDGKHQSYVATESKWPPGIAEGSGTPDEHGQTPITTIEPGENVVIPIHGYCADIRQPPVPSGVEGTPVSNWVSPNQAQFPAPGQLQESGVQTIDAPAGGGPYLANIPNDIDPGAGQTLALGKKTPPTVTAAFLFDAISRISVTTDILQGTDLLTTPFSGIPTEEKPAVVQQAFWLYSSILTGNPYTKDDFSERMTTQYEENSGTKIKNAAPEVQERLENGVNDFWGSFNLVGHSAKVIKNGGSAQSTIPPDIQSVIDNELIGQGATAAVPDEALDSPQYTSDETVRDPDEPKRCKCQEMDVSVVTVKGGKEGLDADQMNATRQTTSVGAEVSSITGNFKHKNEFEVDNAYQLEKGETFSVEVKVEELICFCDEVKCPDIHAEYTEDGKPKESEAGIYSVKNTNSASRILEQKDGFVSDQKTDGSATYEFVSKDGKGGTETLSFQVAAYCSADDCNRDYCVYKFRVKIDFNQ